MMRLMIALICTFFVAPAFAMTTLSSSSIEIVSTTELQCVFVNVSSNPLDVTVNVVDINANLLLTTTFSAVPSHKGETLDFTQPGGPDLFCQFTFSGSSKSLRAALEVTDLTGVPLVTLPAT